MRTKAFHSIVKTCRSTSHVRRHDGLLYNCDVRSCKGGSLASRPERLVPNRLKPGNSRMGPSSAREFAGITHLRCSDSLLSLLSHFPLQLKLGKIRNAPSVLRLASLPAVAFSAPAEAGEKRHPAQRAVRQFAWQVGQRSRRRRSERQRTLQRTFGAPTRFAPCCRIFHSS